MALKQTDSPRLLSLRRSRTHAALWRQVVPEGDGDKVPHRLRFRVARWRNSTAPSPTEDLEEIIAAVGPVEAALIVEQVQAAYELYHGDVDPRDLERLLEEEQEAEGRETAIQVRAARDPAALSAWIDAARLEIAIQRRAIAAALARKYGLERAA